MCTISYTNSIVYYFFFIAFFFPHAILFAIYTSIFSIRLVGIVRLWTYDTAFYKSKLPTFQQ
jgi:hypothetical protein